MQLMDTHAHLKNLWTKYLQIVYHLRHDMFTFLRSLAWLFEQTNMSLSFL